MQIANGSIVPRPFGEAVHSDTPNIVIHFRLDSLKTGFSIYLSFVTTFRVMWISFLAHLPIIPMPLMRSWIGFLGMVSPQFGYQTKGPTLKTVSSTLSVSV